MNGGRTTESAPFVGRLRRTVRTVDEDGNVAYRQDSPWEWQATQRPPFVVRAENRVRNRRQRAARKASR